MSAPESIAAARAAVASPRVRLLVAGVAACAVVALFLLSDTGGYPEIVVPLRLRRLLALMVVACAVAVSTVLFQTVTANRILTPSIMGFDALYILVQTVIVFSFTAHWYRDTSSISQFLLMTAVMIGFAVTLFRWLFTSGRYELHVLILVGIVFSTLFRGATSFLQRLIDPNEFQVVQDLMFASFSKVDKNLAWAALVIVGVAVSAVARRVQVYDVLALGRHTASALGVDHRAEVTRTLMLVAVLVSASTALVGPILFFGLLVAHLAYLWAGTHRHAVVLPLACLVSITALVGGQFLLERVIDTQMSLSIIVDFLGGIVFLILVLQQSRRSLT